MTYTQAMFKSGMMCSWKNKCASPNCLICDNLLNSGVERSSLREPSIVKEPCIVSLTTLLFTLSIRLPETLGPHKEPHKFTMICKYYTSNFINFIFWHINAK